MNKYVSCLTVYVVIAGSVLTWNTGMAFKLEPIVWVQPPSFPVRDDNSVRPQPEIMDIEQDEASASTFARFRMKLKELAMDKKQQEKEDKVYKIIRDSYVIDPCTNSICTALADMREDPAFPIDRFRLNTEAERDLVVVMSQLGDMDSLEYGELLYNILPDLEDANIELRIIGIGNSKSAQMFSLATRIPLHHIRVDPEALVHKRLGCHRGPDWDVPFWVPNNFVEWFSESVAGCEKKGDPKFAREVTRAWMNHMAMSMGIESPGTVNELLRGIVGDSAAPQRIGSKSVIHAGKIVLQGMDNVKFGRFNMENVSSEEKGHQRPMELAAIRLRSANELSLKYNDYVADPRFIDWCGATYLFEDGSLAYEHRNQGILMYSETMSQPLLFLAPYIGDERALDPFGKAEERDTTEYFYPDPEDWNLARA